MTFDKIKAINGRSHRIYDLVRSLERSVEPAARTANGDEETTPRRDALTDLTKANNFFHRHALARCEVTDYRCDVCGLKKDGPTAMQRCKACNFDVCPECVERMAEASDAEFLLQAAVVRGDIDTMTQLLDDGAEVDKATKKDLTPLWIACDRGNTDAARLLLDRGAEVDRAREDGRTPLHAACENGHIDAARLLLDNGAEVDRAVKGATPLSIAKQEGHSSIVALLAEHQK